MAVETEGFSIREYASEMRNVDVVKCWPFNAKSDEISKEDIVALLPPITVKKYRWWSDELELVRPTAEGTPSVKSHGESSKPSLDESTLESSRVEKEKIELVLDPDSVKLDFVCPICRNFTAPTALAAVSHVDECLTRGLLGEQQQKLMKAKAKTRTPKKRSIVEIFAVAPQVERPDSDDDEWEDEEDSIQEDEIDNSKQQSSYSGVVSDMKYKKGKKAKLKHDTSGKLKKQKGITKLKKNVAKNGRHCVDRLLQSIAKEKPRKLKLQSLVKFTGKPKSSHHGKSVMKEIRDAACIHRKKPSFKCLVKKKHKPVDTSKLMKRQKSAIPVCGILKPHKSGTSRDNSTVFSHELVNQRTNLEGDQHLGFPDTRNFLGPKRKPFPSVERPKIPSSCRLDSIAGSASAVKGHVVETDTHWSTEELNRNDEVVSISTGSEKEAQPTRERQTSDIRKSNIPIRHSNIPTYKRPDMSFREYLTDTSVTTSQSSLRHGSSYRFGQAAPVDPLYGNYPAYLSLLEERNISSPNTSAESDILRASSNRTIEYQSGYPSFAVAMEQSKSSFPQLSSPGFAIGGNANGRLRPPAETSFPNYPRHHFPYQQSVHLSPKELIRSLCSFPDWKQRAHMGGNFVNGDLSSLPLNSQGEFIQFNGKGLFNQLTRPAIAESELYRSFTAPSMRSSNSLDHSHSRMTISHQLPVLPVQSPGNDSPTLSLSSGSWERADLQCSGSLAAEKAPSVYNPNFELMTGHMKYNQLRDPMRVVQPTMRLMGKEFTVGRCSSEFRAFEDGKVWTDKQIIAEHQSAATPIHTSLLQKQIQLPVSEVRGNLASSSGTQVRPALQRPVQMRPPDRFGSGYPNHFSCVRGNRGVKLPPYIRPASLGEPVERGGHGSPRPTSRVPKYPSIRGNVSPSTVVPPSNQKMAYPKNSTFEFPFLPPDCGQHIQASRLQNFPERLPPWLFNATHQKTQSGSDLSYPGVSKYHPRAMSPNSIPTHPSEEHAPKSSEGCNIMPGEPKSPNPESSGASIHIDSLDKVHGDPSTRRTIPSEELAPKSSEGCNITAVQPDSLKPGPCAASIHTDSRENKVHEDLTASKESISPRIGVEELDEVPKPRKRPALVAEDSANNPAKVPNLAVTEDSCADSVLSSSMAALGLDSAIAKASTDECGPVETQMNETRSSPATDSVKADGVGIISGPAKLSAGAKHILKPSPNANQEDSRLTHSTIPFAASASSGRIPQPEKSSQIYKF